SPNLNSRRLVLPVDVIASYRSCWARDGNLGLSWMSSCAGRLYNHLRRSDDPRLPRFEQPGEPDETSSPRYGTLLASYRRWPHVELNSNFVFGFDARFSGRLDPEVGLFHGGRAGVTVVLQHHLHRDRPRLPTQRQIPVQRPSLRPGKLRGCRLEHDLLMTLAIEYFRSQHRLLHFGAIF